MTLLSLGTNGLTFTTLWADLADPKIDDMFPQKFSFDI